MSLKIMKVPETIYDLVMATAQEKGMTAGGALKLLLEQQGALPAKPTGDEPKAPEGVVTEDSAPQADSTALALAHLQGQLQGLQIGLVASQVRELEEAQQNQGQLLEQQQGTLSKLESATSVLATGMGEFLLRKQAIGDEDAQAAIEKMRQMLEGLGAGAVKKFDKLLPSLESSDPEKVDSDE